jgi:hypothetical protein
VVNKSNKPRLVDGELEKDHLQAKAAREAARKSKRTNGQKADQMTG